MHCCLSLGLLICLTFSCGQIQNQETQSGDAGNSSADLDEALSELIEQWKTQYQESQGTSAEFFRRTYDNAFSIECLVKGKMTWVSPDTWSIETEPVEITPAMKTAREAPDARVKRSRNGKPYDLTSDSDPSSFSFDGIVLIVNQGMENETHINVPKVNARPTEYSWLTRMCDTMILQFGDRPPVLLFASPELILERCKLTLAEEWSPGDAQARMKVRPLTDEQAASWRSADVILDTQAWKPLHVKIVCPSCNAEYVHSFRDWAEVSAKDDPKPNNQ